MTDIYLVFFCCHPMAILAGGHVFHFCELHSEHAGMAMHVLVCILAEASPFWPSTSSCCGAMVTISHKILIQYKDEKAITVPSDMVMKHGEDDYMRLRPTNYAVIQLICGSSSCNASISSSGKLHELIRLRNEQLMENHEHDDSHEPLFASNEPEPSSAQEAPLKRKKTMKILPETINIMVKGVQVQCLVHGRRPVASDLAIRIDAEQIQAVVEYMREDAIEAMQASKRKYIKKKRA